MDRKTLLEKGFSEEQVTELLNDFHAEKSALEAEKAQLTKDLEAKNKEAQELAGYKTQIDEINKAKMTEQEKIEALRKEAEQNLANAKIINNKAQATVILAAVGITDEGIISTVVSSDADKTLANANLLANAFKTREEDTIKKTKEQLAKTDVTPSGSNTQPGADNVMTWDKFTQLSDEEKTKFQEEHPEEFENL